MYLWQNIIESNLFFLPVFSNFLIVSTGSSDVDGKGGEYPINACNYKFSSVAEGVKKNAHDGKYFPIGSILGKAIEKY